MVTGMTAGGTRSTSGITVSMAPTRAAAMSARWRSALKSAPAGKLQARDLREKLEPVLDKNLWTKFWARARKLAKDDPWIEEKRALIEGDLRALKNTICSCKAIYLCPKCGGEGCSTCKKTGRVTKYALDKAA